MEKIFSTVRSRSGDSKEGLGGWPSLMKGQGGAGRLERGEG